MKNDKEIVEIWEKLGLLNKLNDTEKNTAATYYQKMAETLMKFDNIKYDFDTAAFAIIYKLVKSGYKFDGFNPTEMYTIYCNNYEKVTDPTKDKVAEASVGTCNYYSKTRNTPKIK